MADVSLEQVLALTVANHIHGAEVVEDDGDFGVVLGDGLPIIWCAIHTLREEEPVAAFVQISVEGGALGLGRATMTASGYADDVLEAVATAGCSWACTFALVLLTAVGRPELIRADDVAVNQFEADVAGRRHRVTWAGVDRGIGVPEEEVVAARQQLGLESLTATLLASGTIPHLATDELLSVASFASLGAEVIAEVKLTNRDWGPGMAALADLPTRDDGVVMLREWALLEPLEPAPELTRESLQATLDLLRADDAPCAEVGWLGGRSHGMRLGEPAELSAAGLPEDLRAFARTVAASGAGPGYGLDLGVGDDGWFHLADAGCGVSWDLDLDDGSVWLDSRDSDEQLVRVADSFTAWYRAWLDNAVRHGGPFGSWNHMSDAPASVFSQLLGQEVEDLDGVVIALTTVDGEPIGPCFTCERVANQLGIPSTAFVASP